MKIKFGCLGVFVGMAVSASGWAQEMAVSQQNQSVADTTVIDVFKSPYQFSLGPGVLNYESQGGRDESRLSASARFARNFSTLNTAPSPIQYGVESGLTYSHLGAPNSNFLGAGSDGGGTGGSAFSVPLHVWAGYLFEPTQLQVSLHTGANLFMRTNSTSIDFGRDSDAAFFPDFGFRVGWDARQNYAITFQGNWTIAPNQAIFNGMLGATLPLS